MGVGGSRGGVVRGTSQTRSDSTVTVYLPEYVRGSGAAASVGGAGGAEAFLDPASSTTVASWTTMSSLSFILHSQRFLQRQPQQQRMKIMPLISKEMSDKLSLMKFPLVWGFSGEAVDSDDVGHNVGSGDGLYVIVGLPGVAVGAGVGPGVGLGDGLDVGGSVGLLTVFIVDER